MAEIVQESHNDPWGLDCASAELSGLNYQNGRKNQWQANGKTERESNFGMNILETPFRGYDPALGRFHQPDAITDLLPGISSYAFGFNNPVYFNDPSGLVGEGGSGQDKGVIPPGKRTVDKYGGWVWSAGAMANTAKPSSGGFPPIPDPLKVGGGGEPTTDNQNPLTTQRIRNLAEDQGGIKKAQARDSEKWFIHFNNIVGTGVERAVAAAFGLAKNTVGFQSPGRQHHQETIPDFVAPGTVISYQPPFWFRLNTFPSGVIYEFPDFDFGDSKAAQEVSLGANDRQLQAMIDRLADIRSIQHNQTPKQAGGGAGLVLFLPTNTYIAPSLVKYAQDKGVGLAVMYMYEDPKVKGRIRFTLPRILAGPDLNKYMDMIRENTGYMKTLTNEYADLKF